MGKRLVILAALLVLLVGGAGVIFTQLFKDDRAQQVQVTPPPVKPPVAVEPVVVAQAAASSSSSQPPADADAGSGMAVAAGNASSTAGAAAGTHSKSTAVKVVEAVGPLEKRTPGTDDSWTQVKQGETLQAMDSVRTGRDGTAVLQVGDGARLALSGRTELQVKSVDGEQVRVKLMEGRINADVKDTGGVLGVETQGSDAVAEARAGRFAMMSDGKGQVAVATETGQVRLKAHGKEVAVPKGTVSTVQPGQAPSAPVAIPKSLLLKVASPEKKVQKAPEHEVEGTASPGALVRVKGTTVKVDENGHFKIKVPLKEGQNVVEVAAVDVTGREKVQSYTIQVDTKAPEVKGVMKWGQ